MSRPGDARDEGLSPRPETSAVEARRTAAEFTRQRVGGRLGRETEGLYRLLVDSVRDYAIFALDPNGVILSWNAGAARLKGYTADEAIGRHFSMFYPPERVAERFPQRELEVAAEVGRYEDEGWRVRKDGTRFWANVVLTALRDAHGTLVGYAKVTRDLTNRRDAEEALRASEERTRLLVASVRDYAIFMLDPDGRVATWNAGAQHIKGYTADEIVGHHFSVFYPPDKIAERFPDRELEVAAEIGSFEDEGWRVRKDGSWFWANVVITAVRTPDGRLIGFAKVTRDLTERRAAVERALEDARRLAAVEASNRAKGEFLAAMSHELRTPLNAIGGYAELLAEGIYGGVTTEQRDVLLRIRRSQQHLLTIISDLLNYSRIEAGQVAYDLGAVVLEDVVDAVAPMITPQAQRKGLTFVRPPCERSPVAHADRARVEQVLLNLLSNAVKFTPERGRIEVACLTLDGRAALRVRDTGPGIPADKLDAIFEPFVQLGRSLTTGNEGTGLGLAISRDLARAMGGDLVAESTPGDGATFTLTLPTAHGE